MRFLKTICWMCAFFGMLQISIPARSQNTDANSQTPSGVPNQPPSSAASPAPDQAALKPDGVVQDSIRRDGVPTCGGQEA